MTTVNIEPTAENQAIIETTEKLQILIENLINVGAGIHDTPGTQQSFQALTYGFNEIIHQLGELNSDPRLDKYPIPIDVMNYIEDGRNPDIYTREFIEVNARSNARLKGRMQEFGKLRNILGDKVAAEYPELNDIIKDIKERTSGNSDSSG